MKTQINKLFLYRHRFILGYSFLGLAFAAILIFLPSLSPGGLSEAEMQSAVQSTNFNIAAGFNNDFTNLIYKLLQSASVSIFGLTLYSVKLPSIIIGFLTGALIILLLNRWFKNNVALVASGITILSPLFLFLAGSGTPTILYIFWVTLIFWLGSRIIGARRQHPIIFTLLVLAISLSIYTPHFVYIALLILASLIIHPHIRFSIKVLKIPQIIIGLSVAVLAISPLIVSCVLHPETIAQFFLGNSGLSYLDSIASAFAPFFSFGFAIEGVYLSPLFGLATVALIIIGAIASMNKMFTSRNTVVSLIFLFAIIMSGINQDTATIIFVPIAILVAAAFEIILEKWYSLFPENPYARVFGIIPIVTFTFIIILSGFLYTLFGYHYTPIVAKHFNNDINLIREYLSGKTTLLVPENSLEYDFYKILERDPRISISIASSLPEDYNGNLASLGSWPHELPFPLKQIISSPKQQNSDRLYIYTTN